MNGEVRVLVYKDEGNFKYPAKSLKQGIKFAKLLKQYEDYRIDVHVEIYRNHDWERELTV